jgi:membrane protein involved in colicin uptake
MKTQFGTWGTILVAAVLGSGISHIFAEDDSGKRSLEELKSGLRSALQSVSNESMGVSGKSQAAVTAPAEPAPTDPEARKKWEKQQAEARKKVEKESEEQAKAAERARREAEKEAKKRREREEELAERAQKEGTRYVPERGDSRSGSYYSEGERSSQSRGGWVDLGGSGTSVNSRSSNTGWSSSRENGSGSSSWSVRTTVITLEGPDQ